MEVNESYLNGFVLIATCSQNMKEIIYIIFQWPIQKMEP